jgi:oxygen-independent coproporphyrinogen-3 oxidase
VASGAIALYVHFPWCVAKCPYCDFNSFALRGELPAADYLAALRRDLLAQLEWLEDRGAPRRPIASLFMGGGTPSLFSPESIGEWLGWLRTQCTLTDDVEITLEANPGTIERGRFAGYRDAGVNRVSLGAQSFGAAQLAVLGRIHAADDTRRAAEELHAAGLANFNIDLMYALPGQSLAMARDDVAAALELAPAHVSHYQLTLEAGTPFAALPPAGLPEDDSAERMLEACLELLEARGYSRYEVSAYARAGARCRHNLAYWRFADYLGIGAGAHGKLSFGAAPALEIWRTTRPREPRRFMADPATLQPLAVPPGQRPFEFLLNALRLVDGFAVGEYEAATGLRWSDQQATTAALVARGLLSEADGRLRATARGLHFLNDVLVEYLPEAAGAVPTSPLRTAT